MGGIYIICHSDVNLTSSSHLFKRATSTAFSRLAIHNPSGKQHRELTYGPQGGNYPVYRTRRHGEIFTALRMAATPVKRSHSPENIVNIEGNMSHKDQGIHKRPIRGDPGTHNTTVCPMSLQPEHQRSAWIQFHEEFP